MLSWMKGKEKKKKGGCCGKSKKEGNDTQEQG